MRCAAATSVSLVMALPAPGRRGVVAAPGRLTQSREVETDAFFLLWAHVGRGDPGSPRRRCRNRWCGLRRPRSGHSAGSGVTSGERLCSLPAAVALRSRSTKVSRSSKHVYWPCAYVTNRRDRRRHAEHAGGNVHIPPRRRRVAAGSRRAAGSAVGAACQHQHQKGHAADRE